jgi:hypothetical protein
VSRGIALRGAFLAAIAEPATWALALAAFLVRGGVVLVALPVLVLPTPVGIGNVLAPSLMSVAFGQISVGLIAGTVAIAAGVVGWICIGGWLAALLEAEAARMIARDEDVVAMTRIGRVGELSERDGVRPDGVLGRGLEAAQILVTRLIAYVPLGAALVWGSVRVAVVAYRELTNPLEAGTPVVVRVVRDAPEVIVAVAVAWLVGEIIGSLAARRIALAGDGVLGALRAALGEVVRRPLATLARCVLPLAVLVAVLVPSLLAASAAWRTVQAAIGGSDATALFIAILAFVTLWLVGLLLVAVVSAWRGAVWTVAVVSAPHDVRQSSDVAADDAPSRRHRGAVPPV